MLFDTIVKRDIELRYNSKVAKLLVEKNGRVYGVGVRTNGDYQEVRGKSVVLGCGGFEANGEMRARYLGKNWDIVKVRGTIFNTGDMLKEALNIGACPFGHYSACHNTFVDTEAPQPAIRERAESTRRMYMLWGIVVNNEGKRIMDEGEDYVAFTYAKAGQYALTQPGSMVYQVFDSKGLPLTEDFYRLPEASKIQANSMKELEQGMGLPSNSLVDTVKRYNDGVQPGEFNPVIRDGKKSLDSPVKSNWARKIDEPPFYAYPCTAGITFTFGGLKINLKGQVLDNEGQIIPGLYACGEMVGGVFYYNYPGAGGLSNGAITGRIAGSYAAAG
ncbi:MAG: FAD-binding protein, partial [Dehalococcoidales bacterium]|nr:FAD-binding protein [Dehalococcoidales bacterium]